MDRVFSLLGFAQRSGKIASGAQGVCAVLRKEQAKCLIIAADCSQNTLRKYTAMAARFSVPYYRYGSKLRLGQAIGKAPRSLVAVLDYGFAQAIASELNRGRV
ncbi:MAG TPA: ribosomal L7Ae/L30e/S12e/Gadd45 family protein [Limnochordia bacterium]|jgi:ribosomal protein L7Ae-like RNA K-turn-binding protein|nr:ribosomal L7Ae/L30e/S12e/Gadd45 family protein [Bacillota bacterium]HKM18135.1 ribosomal L7Ae/L30e/S12e/Gadd45 family protein [Limnochordia bacterium]